jgi:hypothetical protein
VTPSKRRATTPAKHSISGASTYARHRAAVVLTAARMTFRSNDQRDPLQSFESRTQNVRDTAPLMPSVGQKPRLPRRHLVPAGQLCLFRDWLPRVETTQTAKPEPKSAAMREVLRILRRAARAHHEAPTNVLLAVKLGLVRQTPARAVRQLEEGGYFRMEVSQHKRRFCFPDGTATGWGDFREGHAPGPKGGARARKPRAPNSPPKPPALPRLPYSQLRAASVCQFPMWEDGERPREHAANRFCGEVAVPGESWCMRHLVIVSPKRAQKVAGQASQLRP